MSVHIGNLPPEWRYLASLAREAGAVAVGVARASAVPDSIFDGYLSWVHSDASAEMTYLRENLPERRDPTSPGIVESATTVVSLAFPYTRNHALPSIWSYVSDHATGRDYHKTIRRRLKQIANEISAHFPVAPWRVFVDSAPVMERTWAVLCGIGTPGRNGMIIVPGIGPQVLLGEIILACPPNAAPETNTVPRKAFSSCTGCNRCVESCPTGALNKEGMIDTRRCLSYITIEKHSVTPPDAVLARIDKIFGCDKCVSVCPHNRPHDSIIETPSIETLASDLDDLANMASSKLQNRLRGTCLFRTGADQIQRNAQQILKNIASRQRKNG